MVILRPHFGGITRVGISFAGLILSSSIFLSHSLVWSSTSTNNPAFVGIPVNRSYTTGGRKGTKLRPHRLNGGYGPASPLTWTPQEAAEFTIFHEGTASHAGMQLRTTIQHWSGSDLAEFLTRLYLGFIETDKEKDIPLCKTTQKIVYEPQNVRTPQWKGLDTREGIIALKDLLKEALSRDLLSAQEIARFGEVFLLKEYRWPSRTQQLKLEGVTFEKDSFYSSGYAQTLAWVFLAIRKEKGYNQFNWNDIALMITFPEKSNGDCEVITMEMIDFFRTISAHTPLTATDKANIVQRMAISGWSPGSIPRFMADLFPLEELRKNLVLNGMPRVQGGAFLDPPCAAMSPDKNANGNAMQNIAIDTAIAKVAGIVGRKDKTIFKNSSIAKPSSQSEYDKLVESYWEKIEIATTKKIKKSTEGYGVSSPTEGYGVSNTKSIKRRKLPDKHLSMKSTENKIDFCNETR